MSTNKSFKRRLIDAATMLLVSGLSLLLLIYVGFSEAQQTYRGLQIEKLKAQGKVVQSTIENFLRPGLPLNQYAGFATVADRIINSDDDISAMAVFDQNGQVVFESGSKVELIGGEQLSEWRNDPNFDVYANNDWYQVVLPLKDKFETVGSLVISTPRGLVYQVVEARFRPMLMIAGALCVGFALFVSIAAPRLRRQRAPWLQISFGLTFLGMAGVLVATLVTLYSEGAKDKTQALADSLGQRLSDIVEFNLNIQEISGVNKTLQDYRTLNPEISAAGITVDGQVVKHSDPKKVGQPWTQAPSTFLYHVQLSPPAHLRDIKLAVEMPRSVVYAEIFRNVKNFAALFVASAFLAGLFLQLAGSMNRAGESRVALTPGEETGGRFDNALAFVKPVFFVAVFVEHMTYAFLSQYMHDVVDALGLSQGFASAPFMSYYLLFALTLVPAGHFAQERSPKPLRYVGLGLAAIGLLLLALPMNFYMVMLARGLSGIGQGMLFIGVQSYILLMSSPGKKTQGAAIIVFGFQGGMISGMAIGSLLVSYIEPTGVFFLASAFAAAMALYAVLVVPQVARSETAHRALGGTVRQLARDLGQVMTNLEFLKTMLFIGVPAKAILTGVVTFALPLLLAQQGYAQEDIGQILMVYAGGVVAASGYMSRVVDRLGNTRMVLFCGAALSGIGLMMVGATMWQPQTAAAFAMGSTAVLIAGVAVVGIAHGFINAPVVTHVADSAIAAEIGASSVTASYRFLERIGHIAGPIIVGQLFIFFGQNAVVLTWAGLAVALLGFLFVIRVHPPETYISEEGVIR